MNYHDLTEPEEVEATISQNKAILEHLKKGYPITPLDALRLYGCFRLASRIHDLRGEGHTIATQLKKLPNGKRIACYTFN